MMPECSECNDAYTLDNGYDDDGMCHKCAHAIAEGRISSMVSVRDLAIRDLRAERDRLLQSLETLATWWGGPDHHRDECPATGGCDECLMADSVNAAISQKALIP
jgi:hypothetical protein